MQSAQVSRHSWAVRLAVACIGGGEDRKDAGGLQSVSLVPWPRVANGNSRYKGGEQLPGDVNTLCVQASVSVEFSVTGFVSEV